MHKLACVLTALVVLLFASPAQAEDPALAALFRAKGLEGTIVIAPLDGAAAFIHNERRAATGFVPASTFKIPNSLILLEEGVVTDPAALRPWDGGDKGWPSCHKDQSLESAFRASCLWFYQELAPLVGPEKYASHLRAMGYGNGLTGRDVTTFWLDGEIRISAHEQIAFLKKLHARAFPFQPAHYDTLARIMIIEQTPAYTLRGKTGWVTRTPPPVGWLVGWAEKGDQVWFYAANMEITRPEDLPLRLEMVKESLKAKGII